MLISSIDFCSKKILHIVINSMPVYNYNTEFIIMTLFL